MVPQELPVFRIRLRVGSNEVHSIFDSVLVATTVCYDFSTRTSTRRCAKDFTPAILSRLLNL